MLGIKLSQGNTDTKSTFLQFNSSLQDIPKQHRLGNSQYGKLLPECQTVRKIYLKYRCQACTLRAHGAK